MLRNAWLTMNRPDVLNAINSEMRQRLTTLLRVLDRDPCTGAALQISLLADLRIGGADAKIGMTKLNVGIPVVIGSSLLLAVIGEAGMRRLVLLRTSFHPIRQPPAICSTKSYRTMRSMPASRRSPSGPPEDHPPPSS